METVAFAKTQSKPKPKLPDLTGHLPKQDGSTMDVFSPQDQAQVQNLMATVALAKTESKPKPNLPDLTARLPKSLTNQDDGTTISVFSAKDLAMLQKTPNTPNTSFETASKASAEF
eukprot:scaffold4376_cov199-Amphora_coffeaeformis.AAC.1